MKWAQQKGFTIVELLIVVVVIAILAAITIVAYNGIQSRAKASAAQSAVSQTLRKLALYAAENNGQYPDTLAQAGIANIDGVQYTGGGTAYCVTGTYQNVSYFEGNATGGVGAGACPGHGNNGATAITNLITNPAATSLTSFGGSGASGTNAVVSNSSEAFQGDTFIRRTFTGSGTNGIYRMTIPITENEEYTSSAWVRASRDVNIRARQEWRMTDGTSVGTSTGAATNVGSDWTRVWVTAVAPAGATRITFTLYSSTSWNAGDTQDIDALMTTRGSTLYNYADGSSSNWVWNGTPNGSTSTGSPL